MKTFKKTMSAVGGGGGGGGGRFKYRRSLRIHETSL